MRLPDFLVVGAQKCGTTSLFLYLSQHPDLFLPAEKEIQFFSAESLYSRGLEWYSNQYFANCRSDQTCGEVSPQYMYSKCIAERVNKALPKAKIIAILRDPVERAYSQYLMSKRRGLEERDVEKALDEPGDPKAEAQAYLAFSDYRQVLGAYLDLYPREQILVVYQEDLAKDPGSVLLKIWAFLGVREIPVNGTEMSANRFGAVRFHWIERLRTSNGPIRAILRTLIPKRLRPVVKFWAEVKNISPLQRPKLPESIWRKHSAFRQSQIRFLKEAFGHSPPWDEVEE